MSRHDWEYSRSQGAHTLFLVKEGVEVELSIRLTNQTYNLINSEAKKDGYDLFEIPYGQPVENHEPIKHGKTVKELKDYASLEILK